MSEDLDWKIMLAITITFISVPFGILFFKTKTEQNTFNRCTNSHVGFWEAAFTELRVEKCTPRESN